MTTRSQTLIAPRTATRWQRANERTRHVLGVLAAATAFALVALLSLAPPAPPTQAELLEAFNYAHRQELEVSTDSTVATAVRDGYSVTGGQESLIEGGTNHDWAKLVLMLAGLPQSSNNVTVFTRWMRQENGPPSWWLRNNPLNNGWGSGGGSGLGSYDNLVIAAENAAEALLSNRGYSGIVAAFAASSPTEVTEQAIWASPWASGHYANGGHWHYTPVEVVTAPASAWGR